MTIGYKAFNKDMTCRGFQYEVGKTYTDKRTLEICETGFHFCERLTDCFKYYDFNKNNTIICVVHAHGNIISSNEKLVTNEIEIVKELSWNEVLEMANSGENNTGYKNSGNENSGYNNSGHFNSGHFNSGNRNSGHYNTGNKNSGHFNSGDRNSGDLNIGYYNSGDRNSGNENSGNNNSGNSNIGNSNTGNYNQGNWNAGSYNQGRYNTGNYNQGNYNTGNHNLNDYCVGDFNSENVGSLSLFNKPISKEDFRKWRECEACCLTNSIKIEFNPLNEDSIISDLKSAYKLWWNTLDSEKKKIIISIPYFDKQVFEEITSIIVN